MIKEITTDDLRRMSGREALIIQGCGGDLVEWQNGINDLLTKEGILQDGTRFENVASFRRDGVTCLLFPFDDSVKLDMGKLAAWRIRTHSHFEGKWLSDFVPNSLGGFLAEEAAPEKPRMELVGHDGNIFSILGRASRLLKATGMRDEAKEMCDRVTNGAHSYGEALQIVSEYVRTEISDDLPQKKPRKRGGKSPER